MREKELLEKGLKSNVCMQNWNMYSIKYMFIMQTVNFAQTVLNFILFYFILKTVQETIVLASVSFFEKLS